MSINHLNVDVDYAGLRLDIFLSKTLSDISSRSFVKKLIDHGHVKVNECTVKANYKVREGEDVLVQIPDDFLTPTYIEPENIPLNIFYEDEWLFVINKPNELLVHPTKTCYKGTLVNALLHLSVNLSNVNTDFRPGIVHRLDQETSGLILVAKDNIVHTKLAKQFQRHTVKKQYIALVKGDVAFDEGVVNAPIGRHPRYRDKKAVIFDEAARKSLTKYCVIKRLKGATLIALYPKTGRTHQLRVHMAYLKHPILGDDKYGDKISFPRLALHAQAIGFTHPHTGNYVEFSSEPPKEFLDYTGLE